MLSLALTQLYAPNTGRCSAVLGGMQVYSLNLKSPEIRNEQDVMMIQQALAHSPGIDVVQVDIENHTVHVTTASQDGGVDVKRRLDDAGFPTDHISVL